MNSRYALDKGNGKLMGVCSGLSNATGADPTLIRLGLVLATFFTGPIAIAAYVVTGLVAKDA
jgi:phage shock protein C